jgi:hypothetical protein
MRNAPRHMARLVLVASPESIFIRRVRVPACNRRR